MAPLRIGTDCAGMEAPIWALENLKVAYRHTFSCDIDKQVKATIEANFPPEVFYDDLTKRDNNNAAPADLYVAGFPCQPFSAAGAQKGFDDKEGRGVLFFYVIDYIRKQQPKVFMLENVVFLARMQNGKYLEAILKELGTLANYNVQWKILNTEDHGIPHNRNRIYFCGIRSDVDNGTFEFPEPIAKQPLEKFLDTRDPELAKSGLPPATATTAVRNVKMFIERLTEEGKQPYEKAYVIDADSSTYRSKCWLERSPCITCNRSKGHWVTNRGRRFRKTEMMRLNGMSPKNFTVVVPETALGRQLGNTMSVNVLERILVRLLPAAGLARKGQLVDRWANGSALRALMKTRDCSLIKLKRPIENGAEKPSAKRVRK